MAIKDWIQTEDTKYTAIFKNKYDKIDYVIIEYERYKNRMVWSIKMSKSRTEYAITKKAAITFAKTYMRNN